MKVETTTTIKTGKGTIPPGQVIDVSPAAFDRLQGKVTALPVQANWQEHTADIRDRDPCGDCWQWVQRNRPDLWRFHIKALHDDDLSTARLTFNQMLTAWEHRHELTQDALL